MAKTKTTKTIALPIGLGITYEVEGSDMLMHIDCTGYYGKTNKGEGKNGKVASSGGRATIARGFKANVNCYDEVPGREGVDPSAFESMVGVEWPLGQNLVGIMSEAGVLTVRIDLDADFGPTKSGKNRRVASSMGNTTIAGPLKLGINIEAPVIAPPKA